MTPAGPPHGSTPVAGRPGDGRFAVLDSEQPFVGRIVTVRVDTVTMPGGGSARREVVEHARAVAVLALDEDGRVVLIEQYRHPLRRRLWEIPAGLMDLPGETPLACAQREFREEVGLAAESWSVLVDFASSPGYSTEAVRVFLARGLTAASAAGSDAGSEPADDEEADLRVVRVPLADAVRAVFDGRIVNVAAAVGVLAADRAVRGGEGKDDGGDVAIVLRPADDPWTDSPALVAEVPPGTAIGEAPRLDRPRHYVTPESRSES